MKGTYERALLIGTVVLVCACTRAQPVSHPSSAGDPGRENANATPAPAEPATAKRSEQDAIGGETTVEIAAPSYVVMDALCRPESAWRVLPHVSNVEDFGQDGGDLVWRVTHTFGIFSGSYVLRIRRDWSDDGWHTIRFWVDTRFKRDVDDAWGYFHLEPLGPDTTRLHYRVRAVLLPGVIRWWFTEKIQWALMVVPVRARDFLERERAAL